MSRKGYLINRARLFEAIQAKKSYLCVGLDPDPDRIPACFGVGVEGLESFCNSIVECTNHVENEKKYYHNSPYVLLSYYSIK